MKRRVRWASQPTTDDAGSSPPPPAFDYVARLRQRQSRPDLCPPLFLAPMENLADRPFRRAFVDTVGGFDEACTGIGNGDVVSVERAHALLRETGCVGLMVGRGAVQDPLLFHRIRHSFSSAAGGAAAWHWDEPEVVQSFLRAYAATFIPELQQAPAAAGHGVAAAAAPPPPPPSTPAEYRAGKLGRLKKVMKYLFAASPQLAAAAERLLRVGPAEATPVELLEALCGQLAEHWPAGGAVRLVLLDHMTKQTREVGGEQAAGPQPTTVEQATAAAAEQGSAAWSAAGVEQAPPPPREMVACVGAGVGVGVGA
ncbi:hypothetical protein GPECTOR_529g526 [Gonium pectorale]|uniref:tRNA-dihydrouridine(47) synthase [NAD(P)(+)] n=1 Tax=Gonium pectorale TaxID=33097 RepID=A0A150FUU2_GONPE|nr:hypothetical protein GPECTOR_529g526 [Gonium pectorale]|eukprot:KXZ41348.1 hypothetical protein GPECTOR_529g526 [Gonium pectorale]